MPLNDEYTIYKKRIKKKHKRLLIDLKHLILVLLFLGGLFALAYACDRLAEPYKYVHQR